MTMRNRRGAHWLLESSPWAAHRASRRAARQVERWGHPAAGTTVRAVTTLLVGDAVRDGGTRVSLHLTDRDRRILVLVLSHRRGPNPADGAVLRRVARLGVGDCGSDAAGGGRRLWAVIDSSPATEPVATR
ncbi:hypothetical protein [Streptomyces sp. NPDC018031]|uniref:hypothetical protein n=1 Tax=Streptomyces sp. NPDC018031 TaxID=3365033 RepID=UPI0037AE0A5A